MNERPDPATQPLSALVWDYVQRQGGDSLRALARRCVDPDTGMDLKRPWLADLAADNIGRAPELWRLRALAAGIGEPLERMQLLAARQWLGLDEATFEAPADSDRLVVRVPPALSPANRARVIRWAERWARDLAGDGEDSRP